MFSASSAKQLLQIAYLLFSENALKMEPYLEIALLFSLVALVQGLQPTAQPTTFEENTNIYAFDKVSAVLEFRPVPLFSSLMTRSLPFYCHVVKEQ